MLHPEHFSLDVGYLEMNKGDLSVSKHRVNRILSIEEFVTITTEVIQGGPGMSLDSVVAPCVLPIAHV